MAKYKGTGVVSASDFKEVRWVGKDKGGSAVTITLKDAVMMSNIDLSMVEKDDTVATLEFTACYDNTDAMSTDATEAWTIEIAGTTAGASEVLLGAGLVYIGGSSDPVALTRGGSKFTVEREFRQINADGDRGPVKGRVVLEGSTAKLTLNALTWLTDFTDLFPATAVVTG